MPYGVKSAVALEPLATFLYHLRTSASATSSLYFAFSIPIDNSSTA